MTETPTRRDGDNPKVEATVRFFDLGAVVAIEGAPSGLTNRNWLLDTERGQFVAREVRGRSAVQVTQEMRYADHARAHGLPAPSHVATSAGERILHLGDRLMVVQRRLQGEHPAATPAVCAALGATLARLHTLPFESLPPRTNWLSAETAEIRLRELRAVPAMHGHALFAAADRLRAHAFDDLPRSIVHADIHPYNLLFEGECLTALLDWEEATIGASIFDLASAIAWLCVDRGRVDGANVDAMLARYTDVRPLLPLERARLPMAVAFVAHTVSAWLLHRYALVTPDEVEFAAVADLWGCDMEALELQL